MGACGSQEIPQKYDSQRTGPDSNTPSSLDKNKFHSNDTHRSSNHQLRVASSLRMPSSNIYQCSQCGMTFSTDEALYKHRTRYCLGPVDANVGKRLYYSDDDDVNQLTPRTSKHQSPIEKV